MLLNVRRAIFPHAGHCWSSHSRGDWGSVVVANATEVQHLLLGPPKAQAHPPPEGNSSFRATVETGAAPSSDRAKEPDLVGFKAAARFHDMEGVTVSVVSDARKGELRTKEQRSESTNFQSGSHQRPIALN